MINHTQRAHAAISAALHYITDAYYADAKVCLRRAAAHAAKISDPIIQENTWIRLSRVERDLLEAECVYG